MAEDESSFLDLGNLDDVAELTTKPLGEYELQLANLEQGAGKDSGKKYLRADLDIIGEPDTKSVTHIMMLPTAEDPEKQRRSRLRAIKHFYNAFGIPTDGTVVIYANYIGRTGWAILDEENSEQYGKRNRVKQFTSK
jgi:hypothetical protein